MKKKMSIFMVFVLIIVMLAGFMSVQAEDPTPAAGTEAGTENETGNEAEAVMPEFFYALDEDQKTWIGENSMLDYVSYTQYYEATELRLYNAEWAGRFGGVAILGQELNMNVSSAKNRYMVLNIMPDSLAIENQMDKLNMIYYKAGDDTVHWGDAAKDSFSVLYDASIDVYTKVIVDLAWGEEEFTLDRLRFDIFCSSYETACEQIDGASCGTWYMNYIAFFDTLEAAQAFEYAPEQDPTEPPATDAPATATPEATQGTSEEPDTTATSKPTTSKAPDGDDTQDEKKSPVVAIVIAAVVVVVAVVAILLLLKGKKK